MSGNCPNLKCENKHARLPTDIPGLGYPLGTTTDQDVSNLNYFNILQLATVKQRNPTIRNGMA